MPLPRAEPRQLIHARDVDCRGYRRDDGLWDIEGMLVDTKTYSFDNVDRAGIRAGEPIHGMAIRLTLTDNLEIRAVAAIIDQGPFNICGDVAPDFEKLVGLRIGPGWRKQVLARLGGIKGCTHLVELVMGQMAATAYQTVRPARNRRESSAPDPDGARRKPALLDTCHALATDSPAVKRHWPDFYTGD